MRRLAERGAADRLTSALTETREMIVAERASSAQLEARVPVLENSATRQDLCFRVETQSSPPDDDGCDVASGFEVPLEFVVSCGNV